MKSKTVSLVVLLAGFAFTALPAEQMRQHQEDSVVIGGTNMIGLLCAVQSRSPDWNSLLAGRSPGQSITSIVYHLELPIAGPLTNRIIDLSPTASKIQADFLRYTGKTVRVQGVLLQRRGNAVRSLQATNIQEQR
jgi:hypothetical protein